MWENISPYTNKVSVRNGVVNKRVVEISIRSSKNDWRLWL